MYIKELNNFSEILKIKDIYLMNDSNTIKMKNLMMILNYYMKIF